MAQSVDPILLDSTGQDMVTALNAIANKTVDSALSTTSVNPVQNKVITGEINGIKEKIPSGASSSNKMATANDITGVQNAVKANTQLIKDTVGFSGKNLLKYPYKGGSSTNRGITFTDNGDGTLTLNGTQSDSSNNAIYQFFGFWDITTPLILPPGKYIFTTGVNDNNIMLSVSYSNTFLGQTNAGVLEVNAPNGITYITCEVAKGATLNNVKVYPMVRDVNILDDTYEPYADTTAFPRSEQAVLGAKNLLIQPYPNASLNKAGDTIVSEGITWKLNDDMSVSAISGTATNVGQVVLSSRSDAPNTIPLKKGKYILSGVPKVSGCNIHLATTINGSYYQIPNAIQYPNDDEKVFEITDDLLVTGKDYCAVGLYCAVGSQTVSSEIKFYPMIRLATDPDDTYAPYAMTNRELTEKINTTVTGTHFATASGEDVTKNIKISMGYQRLLMFVYAGSWEAVVLLQVKQHASQVEEIYLYTSDNTKTLSPVFNSSTSISVTFPAQGQIDIMSTQPFEVL